MDTAVHRELAGSPPGSAGASDEAFARDAAPDNSEDTGMWEPIARAATAFKRVLGSYAVLAVLDMRRATVQLAWLVGSGIVVSVLVVTAWLAAVVGIAVWLFGEGLSWPAVLFIAAGLNMVAAGIVVWRMRHVFEAVPFAATLRQLKADQDEHGGAK